MRKPVDGGRLQLTQIGDDPDAVGIIFPDEIGLPGTPARTLQACASISGLRFTPC
jgi:hypothetical protein